jgi:hypothetical protein
MIRYAHWCVFCGFWLTGTGCYQDKSCGGQVVISGLSPVTPEPSTGGTPAPSQSPNVVYVIVDSLTDTSTGAANKCSGTVSTSSHSLSMRDVAVRKNSVAPAATTCNLRSALVFCAETVSDECVISLPVKASVTMKASFGAITVTSSLSKVISIEGNLAVVKSSALTNPPDFLIAQVVDFSLNVHNITITDFSRGIYVYGDGTIKTESSQAFYFDNILFEDNSKALSVEQGVVNVWVTNCYFKSNTRSLLLYFFCDYVTVDNCIFEDNLCDSPSCGITSDNSNYYLVITNSQFINNRGLSQAQGGQ